MVGEDEVAGGCIQTAAPWPDLAGDVGFDAPGHHNSREEVGEQEEDMANLIRASGWPYVARWRAIRGGVMVG